MTCNNPASAGILPTVYEPYMKRQYRPYEIEFMRSFYGDYLVYMIAAVPDLTAAIKEGRAGWLQHPASLIDHAGSVIERAFWSAANHLDAHGAELVWRKHQRVHLAGPGDVSERVGLPSRVLWVHGSEADDMSMRYRAGLNIVGHELWIDGYVDSQTAYFCETNPVAETAAGVDRITLDVLAVDGEPIPRQWGKPVVKTGPSLRLNSIASRLKQSIEAEAGAPAAA